MRVGHDTAEGDGLFAVIPNAVSVGIVPNVHTVFIGITVLVVAADNPCHVRAVVGIGRIHVRIVVGIIVSKGHFRAHVHVGSGQAPRFRFRRKHVVRHNLGYILFIPSRIFGQGLERSMRIIQTRVEHGNDRAFAVVRFARRIFGGVVNARIVHARLVGYFRRTTFNRIGLGIGRRDHGAFHTCHFFDGRNVFGVDFNRQGVHDGIKAAFEFIGNAFFRKLTQKGVLFVLNIGKGFLPREGAKIGGNGFSVRRFHRVFT